MNIKKKDIVANASVCANWASKRHGDKKLNDVKLVGDGVGVGIVTVLTKPYQSDTKTLLMTPIVCSFHLLISDEVISGIGILLPTYRLSKSFQVEGESRNVCGTQMVTTPFPPPPPLHFLFLLANRNQQN